MQKAHGLPADLIPRTTTALVLAPLAVVGVLGLADPAFATVAAGLLGIVLWEWLRLSGVRRVSHVACACALASGLYLAIWGFAELRTAAIWTGLLFWSGAAVWLAHAHLGAAGSALAVRLKGGAGVLLCAAMYAAMLTLAYAEDGRRRLLYLIGLVCLLDTLCYLIGRFGRFLHWRPLAPGISPNKNTGVLAASLALTLAVGWVCAPEASAAQLLALGVALGFGVVGDLLGSLMKRHARVKDSGGLLPGHGGLMDRLDSMLAATPVFAATQLVLR